MFGFSISMTLDTFLTALYQTFIMVAVPLIFSIVIGTFMAVLLVISRPNGIKPNVLLYHSLNIVINILRSIPSLILLVLILPLSKIIIGTSVGTMAAVVPLIFFVSPYMARLMETSLLEVNEGIIEAADSMGATTWQVIWHFLLPEAKSSLILCLTTATIGLIGATAIAGAIGAGGLGDLALNYGYQRFDNVVMFITVVTLVIIVQVIQTAGNRCSKSIRNKSSRKQ